MLKQEGERWSGSELKFFREPEIEKVVACVFVFACVSMCVFHFPVEQLLVANLACAPVSSREVIDVCSIQKACWETVTDLSQAPWTSRLIPRTWPNAFRNSQMAAIEGFTVPNV